MRSKAHRPQTPLVVLCATIAGALLIGVVSVSPARAGSVLHVPQACLPIQAAINAAVDGDVVLVAPGTYHERIDNFSKNITIESEAGPNVTVIDGDEGGIVVRLIADPGESPVLRGFTVQDGYSFPSVGGIYTYGGPALIENNMVSGCTGGIAVNFSAAVVRDNTVFGAEPRCVAGIPAIDVVGAGTSALTGNLIIGNYRAISLNAAGSSTISENTITGNTGAGIDLGNVSNAQIENNVIAGNGETGSRGSFPWGSRDQRSSTTRSSATLPRRSSLMGSTPRPESSTTSWSGPAASRLSTAAVSTPTRRFSRSTTWSAGPPDLVTAESAPTRLERTGISPPNPSSSTNRHTTSTSSPGHPRWTRERTMAPPTSTSTAMLGRSMAMEMAAPSRTWVPMSSAAASQTRRRRRSPCRSAQSIDATSPAGAIASYEASATDDVDGPVPVTCEPPSGSLLPIGDTTVECAASDSAGNTAEASFNVHVKGAIEQIGDLKAAVATSPAAGLNVMLDRALKALAAGQTTRACNELATFARTAFELARPPRPQLTDRAGEGLHRRGAAHPCGDRLLDGVYSAPP